MPYNDAFLDKKLDERISGNYLRSLIVKKGLIDLCSNDYLGIATRQLLNADLSQHDNHGSKGSRSLTGNSKLAEDTESMIADFHDGQAALLFNSGYNANTGILGSVPQRGDIIFYDALSHASIRDGIRLSRAQSISFTHNDLYVLEEKFKQIPARNPGNIFVTTESVFSMDGDLAPLAEMLNLCEKYGAHMVLDEAHAIGVMGENGEGLAQSMGLHNRVFARIYTYGKAPGCHGASVVGSLKLKSYLINFARSFIFTTALPEIAISAIAKSYSLFPHMKKEREQIRKLISFFQSQVMKFEKLRSLTPVQGLIIPGNSAVKSVSVMLEKNGFDIRPILYPSVQEGKERLRISLHAFNTEDQLSELTYLLNQNTG